jgi:hypothetical protein
LSGGSFAWTGMFTPRRSSDQTIAKYHGDTAIVFQTLQTARLWQVLVDSRRMYFSCGIHPGKYHLRKLRIRDSMGQKAISKMKWNGQCDWEKYNAVQCRRTNEFDAQRKNNRAQWWIFKYRGFNACQWWWTLKWNRFKKVTRGKTFRTKNFNSIWNNNRTQGWTCKCWWFNAFQWWWTFKWNRFKRFTIGKTVRTKNFNLIRNNNRS